MIDANGGDIGSVYGPCPLFQQEVPGAEAYALLCVLEMCIPPITIYTDCMSVYLAWLEGCVSATEHTKMYADVWRRIRCVLDDIGPGVEVRWTKAHASAQNVADGSSTYLERIGNRRADGAAKLGAAMHPVNVLVQNAWQNIQTQQESVGKFLARCTARQGRDGHLRDTDAMKQEGAKGCKASTCALHVMPPTRVDRFWDILAPSKLVLHHRLWEAEDEQGTSIVYCCKCFAYTSRIFAGKLKLLKAHCAGGVDASRFAQQSRILSGTHPQHGKGSIFPPMASDRVDPSASSGSCALRGSSSEVYQGAACGRPSCTLSRGHRDAKRNYRRSRIRF
jgi:hypothetical protein